MRNPQGPNGPDEPQKIPHVVVIGGGFGGLTLVRELASVQRRGRLKVRITLVDRHNHHTFQPLLYQIATAGLQPQDVGISLRAILRLRGVEVRLGEATDIDTADRVVFLSDGTQLSYDRLVLAAGAITADFGVPGVAEHAYSLKSLADATTMRNEVLRRFEEASSNPERATDGGLTFVISGGGPTGVELAGALAELVDLVVRRDHPSLDLAQVRIVLAEPQDRLLGGFSPRSSKAAVRGLRDRGVDVRLGVGIARVAADHVELTDGEVLPTRLVVWAAGVAASPLTATLGIELARGRRLTVDSELRVRGTEGVFAIGDLAACTDPHGQLLPQVAPVAMQQARFLARLLADEAAGRSKPVRFRYRDKGTMATIGRAAAVAEMPGHIRLQGLVAWVAWLLLHLLMLVGFRNRVAVLISWIWNYVTRDHAARLILDQREAATTETADGPVRRSWAN